MALTKMMLHYLETKRQNPDCIVFYRLGDFYEMFFEDAELCSRELELTLTGKDCGLEKRAPMCGIPHHAANQYIEKLIEKNYKVAICEQLTQPVKGQKLVERGVVKIITPGTVFDSEMLDDEKNNFIASIYFENGDCALSWVDVSTGEFFTSTLDCQSDLKELSQALIRIAPSEILSNNACDFLNQNLEAVKQKNVPKIEAVKNFSFSIPEAKSLILSQFKGETLKSLGIEQKPINILSIGGVLFYLNETQKRYLCHINKISIIDNKKYLVLDSKARRNLELLQNSITGKKQGSLLGVLNHCETSMGSRMLRNFISEPLINKQQIEKRLECVSEFFQNPVLLSQVKEALHYVRDIERLTARIASNQLYPRQARALLDSLLQVDVVKNILKDCHSKLVVECLSAFDGLEEVSRLLQSAIVKEPPLNFKDGGYIAEGFNKELDEFRKAKDQGAIWLAQLEAKEKELTNIKNLKIGYNSNFGYYFEVLNSQKDLVPFRFVRKQTTISAERFITDELKDLENKILNADENIAKLELKIFNEIREFLLAYVHKFQQVAKAFATIDVLSNFAFVSANNNFVKPQINEDGVYDIVDGRHPVVESFLKEAVFSPNDTLLTNDQNIMLITGPNMAGKSTYMRQVAIITIMAHMGCFVPATSANIAITDRIFTRIGASDDLAFGQSTFMVEMCESATILKEATKNSLIILDEVGRGTSTFDGLSIAYAIVDYISKNIKAKTLFATHYHELASLESTHSGIVNFSVAVKEFGGEIIFLHKIVKGSANKSFGIEVAKLAGLPSHVVASAKEYLLKIEKGEQGANCPKTVSSTISSSVNINQKAVLTAIKNTDIDTMSPLKALEFVSRLKEKLKED